MNVMKEKKVSTTAERLRERLTELNMRQVELSRKTGIDQGSICHYISGKYEPKDKAMIKMAAALDVSEAWLWGYDVPKKTNIDYNKNDDLVKIIARAQSSSLYFDYSTVGLSLSDEELKTILQMISLIKTR